VLTNFITQQTQVLTCMQVLEAVSCKRRHTIVRKHVSYFAGPALKSECILRSSWFFSTCPGQLQDNSCNISPHYFRLVIH